MVQDVFRYVFKSKIFFIKYLRIGILKNFQGLKDNLDFFIKACPFTVTLSLNSFIVFSKLVFFFVCFVLYSNFVKHFIDTNNFIKTK